MARAAVDILTTRCLGNQHGLIRGFPVNQRILIKDFQAAAVVILIKDFPNLPAR